MSVPSKVCPRCHTRYDGAAVFCQRDGAVLRPLAEPDPRIGQTILDQFRIEEKIGSGGMGAVYRARQESLARDVAIKILHGELAQDADAVRRFHREAKISTALDHPNVVRVVLFGQLPDGSLYIVMEHLKGRTLSDLLRMEPRLLPARALHIVLQVCAGVAEAHAHNIVHRDIKPENVFLMQRGRDPDFAKVLDFGIARLLGAENTIATQTGLVFGTARYISPEGASGEHTDARSDVYSIGVMLYQMLTGQTPFDATTPVQLLLKHIQERPVPIQRHPGGQGIPEPLAQIVMRCLEKSPHRRYADANALADALRDVARQLGLDTTMPSPSSSGSVVVPRDLATASAPHAVEPEVSIAGLPRPRRGLGRAVAIALVLGLLASGGTYAAISYQHTREIESARLALVDAAETALEARHFDEPEGSVVAITRTLAEQHPDDPNIARLRHEAAARLAAEAELEVSARHREAALALYARARAITPDDTALETAEARARAATARTASIMVAPTPVALEEVALTAVVPDGLSFTTADHPRFIVKRDGRKIGRRINATPGASEGTYEARYTFAQAGRYDLEFHGGDGDDCYTQSIVVEVARPARVPAERSDPPITTQGSYSPPSNPTTTVAAAPFEPTAVPAWTTPSRPAPEDDPNLAPPPSWTSQ